MMYKQQASARNLHIIRYTNEYTSQGLIYLRARWYSPANGRFQTKDAWQGDYTMPASYNAWLYVYSNPIIFIDPSGKRPFCEGIYRAGKECNETTEETQQVYGYSEKRKPAGIRFNPGLDPLLRGATGIEYGKNKAQFINEGGKKEYANKYGQYLENKNLCGQVSIAAILAMINPSVTLFDVLRRYEDTMSILNNQQTTIDDLYKFRNAAYSFYMSFSGTKVTALIPESKHWWSEEGRKLTTQRIREKLNEGNLLLVTVNIDGSTGKVGWNNPVSHWVVITGISNFEYDTKRLIYDGSDYDFYSPSNWLRIYNPFDNETEYYTYEDFRNSWMNNGNNLIIVRPNYQAIGTPSLCKYGYCCE